MKRTVVAVIVSYFLCAHGAFAQNSNNYDIPKNWDPSHIHPEDRELRCPRYCTRNAKEIGGCMNGERFGDDQQWCRVCKPVMS